MVESTKTDTTSTTLARTDSKDNEETKEPNKTLNLPVKLYMAGTID